MIEAFFNAWASLCVELVNVINFAVDRPILIAAFPLACLVIGTAIGIIKLKIMQR